METQDFVMQIVAPTIKRPFLSDYIRSSFRAAFPKYKYTRLMDMVPVLSTSYAVTYAYQIHLHCIHKEGVAVSGGRWMTSVPRDPRGVLLMAFCKVQDGTIQYHGVPYRPAALPLELFRLTPDYWTVADLFGGAADWTPA